MLTHTPPQSEITLINTACSVVILTFTSPISDGKRRQSVQHHCKHCTLHREKERRGREREREGGGERASERDARTMHYILDIFHPSINTVLCCIMKHINNIKIFVSSHRWFTEFYIFHSTDYDSIITT
jgi:hypothetical protein